MKVLVDMNLSPDWVNFLNAAGHDAIHWSKIGSGSATDAEVMTWATNNDHVVLTADLDFGAILATTKGTRPSVIQVRNDILSTGAVGDIVASTLRQANQELTDGALISIDAVRARLRVLPLKTK